MRKSIEFKVLTVVVVVLLLGAVVVGFFSVYMQKSTLYSATESASRNMVRIILKEIESTMNQGKADVTRDLLKNVKEVRDLQEVTVFNDEGREAFQEKAPIVESEVLKEFGSGKEEILKKEKARLTFYLPLKNGQSCKKCHGEAKPLLGAVKTSVTIENEYNRALRSVTVMVVGALLGSLGVSFLLWFILRRMVISPVKSLNDAATKIAEGDLTVTANHKSHDQIGTLSSSMNKMVSKLKEIIKIITDATNNVSSGSQMIRESSRQVMEGASSTARSAEQTLTSMEEMAASIAQVAKNSEALATNVDETSATINEMAASIEQVGRNTDVMAASVGETSATIEQMISSIEQSSKNSSSMTESVNGTSMTVENLLSSVEQISRGTESLKHMVTESSGTIEEMMRTVQEVATKIGDANRLSQNAYRDAEQGGKGIYQSIESLQNIGKTTEKTMGIIENLGKRSEEIGSIVEVINEIADQTNLLALNAAIEAARAGDAGRGFAVVADEIRKLAERSMEATKEIGSVIRQVQGETATAVKATEETYREGKGGMALASSSRDAFNSIIEAVKDTSQIMEGIARSAGELNKATGQVMNYIVEMNSASGEVADAVKAQADGTGMIRKTIEKMNRQVQEVNIATKEQAVGGKQIREALERMKTVVHEVNIAVKEQVKGARQIVESVEMMKHMTQDVANAAAEQKAGGDTVVKAMEGMSHIAAENLKLSADMKGTSEDTLLQVESLQQSVSRFKIETNGDGHVKEGAFAGV